MPILGLIFVLSAFVFFDDQTQHPSLVTLLPVTGTMILIWFTKKGELVSDVLASKPLVAVGLISYGFYLWHFPIFAFARIKDAAPTHFDKIEQIALAVAFSVLTYFMIEKPVRKSNVVNSRVFLASILMVSSVFLGVFGYFYNSGGVAGRFGQIASLYYTYSPLQDGRNRNCNARKNLQERCKFGRIGATPIYVLGDSHAQAIAGGSALSEFAENYNFELNTLYASACLSIPGIKLFNTKGVEIKDCTIYTERLREFFLQAEPGIIIWNGRLPLWITGTRFDNAVGGVEAASDFNVRVRPKETANLDEFLAIFRSYFTGLLEHGHKIVLVYPVPEVGWNVPNRVRKELSGHTVTQQFEIYANLSITIDYQVVVQRASSAIDVLDGVGRHENLIRIYPRSVFCKEALDKCFTHDEKGLFYSDDDHLSVYGASLLVEEIERAFRMEGWIANSN